MLGKLIKYELKYSSRIMLPFFAACLMCAYVIGKYYASGSIIQRNTIVDNIAMPLIFIFSFFGLAISTIFVIVKRFEKNLFSQEGYLTFTLPVSTSVIIFSKLVTSVIWVIAASVIMLLSAILISSVGVDFKFISVGIKKLMQDPVILKTFIITMISVFIGVVTTILFVYAALSVGQSRILIKNKKVLSGLFAILVLIIYNKILTFASQIIFKLAYKLDDKSFSYGSNFFDTMTSILSKYSDAMMYQQFSIITVNLIFATMAYFLTAYIIKHHLNLDA